MPQTRILFICHGNSDEIRSIMRPNAHFRGQNAAGEKQITTVLLLLVK